MHTYRGKIGRLPTDLREQINQRLEAGETGEPLLAWLNALPAVQSLLYREFDGHPITQQNLSNWHLGGYQHWLQQQERRELVRQLAQDAGELDAEAGGEESSHHWSAVLTAELAATATQLLATTTDPAERCARLQELLLTLVRVRHADCRAGRLKLDREIRARDRVGEQAEAEERAAYRRENKPLADALRLGNLNELFNQPDLLSQTLALQEAEALMREAALARAKTETAPPPPPAQPAKKQTKAPESKLNQARSANPVKPVESPAPIPPIIKLDASRPTTTSPGPELEPAEPERMNHN